MIITDKYNVFRNEVSDGYYVKDKKGKVVGLLSKDKKQFLGIKSGGIMVSDNPMSIHKDILLEIDLFNQGEKI